MQNKPRAPLQFIRGHANCIWCFPILREGGPLWKSTIGPPDRKIEHPRHVFEIESGIRVRRAIAHTSIKHSTEALTRFIRLKASHGSPCRTVFTKRATRQYYGDRRRIL